MRDDFSAKTNRILADRVNSICSNPTCKAQTRGPKIKADASVNLGKAAHITAASPGGPRYDDTLTPEERAHFNNGIWLCGICADLIDSDITRFPVDLLKEWKREAEMNAAVDLGKPRGFSRGRLAQVSSARAFGTETNVSTERRGIIAKATIPNPVNNDEVISPTYFENGGYVRQFKIQKRAKLKHIILDDIQAIVHAVQEIPPYRPMYGAYPTETSLYTIDLKVPLEGQAVLCSAERFYESSGPRESKERRYNSLVIDNEVPHVCIIRLNATVPGMYFVSLRVVLSVGMKQEVHTIMGPTPVIFEMDPDYNELN